MNQPFNILILDPHQCLEPSLADLLREKGHHIKVLADRLPTPTLVASHAPDLVLADVASGPGLDLVTALQFSRTTRHIPIIASSAQAELEYELLDVFDFLSHPIDRQRLFDDVTLIAGAELGGVALAAATAMESGKNWVIIRNSKKGYGTSKMVEGVLKEGDVVLLVEDIATTGGQVLEAAKIITEAGATVKEIVCVIDRKQGAGENITEAGYKFGSILTKDDLGIKDTE